MLKFKEYTQIREETKEKLDTSASQPVVIAPGRFNPPTRGHKIMIQELINLGEQLNAKPVIIIVDSGKYNERNPLTGEVRRLYLQKMFPGVDIHISKNAYQAVYDLYAEHNKVPVGGVTGADRADSYKGLIGRVFGPEEENQYQTKILHRDPDSNDIEGISGTKAREAAVSDNEAAFRAMTGLDHEDAIKLMSEIRKGISRTT